MTLISHSFFIYIFNREDDIFTQVVQMLVDAKFVSLEVQYMDGTKIEANANKYTFVWKKATKISWI